ncbi:MAG TPA: amidase [Acidobacteria bacterium]|nr:amidase [Acidobacteriota bacterium]
MTNDSYDLASVKLPKAGGAALAALVRAMEGPLRGLLIGNLLKNAGVTGFRRLVIDEPPSCRPELGSGGDDATANGPAKPVLPSTAPDVPGERPPGVRDFAEAYRTGRTGPVEVAERVLAAIEASDAGAAPLRAFIAFDREAVLRQARASAERLARGEPLGPLDGVPVAVKDEVDMLPHPTTVGTRFLGAAPPPRDATVVARLRAAGAVLLGKTNMHEIGIAPTGFNPHHGQVRNPYDPDRDTGGSSSGSAAAVAAGLCPLAVGADGGGSIRIPSSFCGVVGLKATFGRVSEAGAAPLCWSVAHLGPIAATVEDAALGYAVMAGPDPRDPGTLAQPAPAAPDLQRRDLRGTTVGIFRPWFEHAQPAVVEACERAVRTLERAGARLHEVHIPDLDAVRVAHAVTILSEMAAAMAPWDGEHRKDFGLDSRLLLALAREFTATDYVLAQRVRTRAVRRFLAVLEEVDVLATPAAAVTAPPIPRDLARGESDTSTVVEVMRFAFPGNFTGLPAVVVPVGYDPSGLPIGLQLMGRPWHEHRLLELARTVEATVERRRPGRFFDILP